MSSLPRGSMLPEPDLHGYRLERKLSQGAFRRVWLARNRASNRQVVLKFATPERPAPENAAGSVESPAFGAGMELRHPNIVRVRETLVYASAPVAVLEYIAGGDLKQRLQRGIGASELARTIDAIGAALDHAHGQGFVHLDIRPENILFRPDDSPVLTDFTGGWRIEDGQPPAGYAAAAGMPGFMSPEQAGGRTVDGRSDLYALGAVLHNVLTGEAPHQSEGVATGGNAQFADRALRLPAHLDALQPIVERALARNPAQRFERGADLAAALVGAFRETALAETTFKSVAVSVEEIRALTGGPFTAPVDSVRQEPRGGRRRRAVARTLMPILLALAAGGGGVYLFTSQPLWLGTLLAEAGLAENPLLRTAWLDARSLHQDPNQSLSAIVAGYRRVLSLDAEHVQAQSAIQGLAEQWRVDVLDSLLRNDIVQAETKLAEMSAAFPGHAAQADLQAQLTDRKTAAALLSSTRALLDSHGLSDVPSATAAIQAYQEVLRLAPGHPMAQLELDALGDHYAGLARDAAVRGDVQQAISFLERATAAIGDSPLLAEVRGEIQQATTAQAAIEELLQQARAYRLQGWLVTPPGENAAELYNRVLATAPDNALARQGLSEVTSQLLNQAARLLASDEFAAVGRLVDQARAAGIESDSMRQIKTRLDERTAALTTVATNLREAESLLREGFVTEPPERNAVALLREAERLDPGNERADALLKQAAARLVEVAMEAQSAGLEEEARQYLELALTVTPDVPAWRALRESWE